MVVHEGEEERLEVGGEVAAGSAAVGGGGGPMEGEGRGVRVWAAGRGVVCGGEEERGEEWLAHEGGGVGEWWHFANDRWAREELGPHVSVLNDMWCR